MKKTNKPLNDQIQPASGAVAAVAVKKTKKPLNEQTQRTLGGVMMALPSFIIITVFFLGPILMSLFYSFTDWNGYSIGANFIGIKNYISVIQDRNFGTVVGNSLYLLVLYVPVMNVLALALATLIFGMTKKGIASAYKSIIFFPNLLSPTVVGFIWLILYQYKNGIINKTLRSLQLDILVRDWLGSAESVLPAISVSITWYAVGYFLIIYTAGLTTIPLELYESAEVEGANGIQRFWNITIPMLAPSITINVILSTIGCISTFEFPYVMTKGGPGAASQTFGLQIFKYSYSTRQAGNAMAMAMIMAVIAIVIALIEWGLLHKKEDIY